MVDETDKFTGTDIDDSPTPHLPGEPEAPFDHTMRLDRAIAEGDLSLPSRFGRYEVLNRIGVGGFASVFSARDPELDSPVAIKVLAENHAADVEVRKRFVAEARVARRLGGDRLIDVFDLGETDDGRPFVVMELAAGGTLRARLSRIGRPSPAALLRLIDELGACMIAIHAKNVVHRDIKPSNLLLRTVDPGQDGRPTELIESHERLVLADFGLARDISGGASAVTVGGGTAAYMAPEQADPEGKADFRADIYAASVVLAELTTGRHPERLDLGTANLTTEVMEALEQGLSIDREQRPSSAEAWRARLLHAYRSGGPYANGSGPAPPVQGSSMATRFDLNATDDFDNLDILDGLDNLSGDRSLPGSSDDGPSPDGVTARPADEEVTGATNILPTADRQRPSDATNIIDPTAIIDPDDKPRPGRPESATEVQFDSALIDSALSGGEGLEPRTFVKPPEEDGPPPPPPSIPLSPKIQRPAPNKAPPRRQAPETIPVQRVGDPPRNDSPTGASHGGPRRPSAHGAPETVPVQPVVATPETVPVQSVAAETVPLPPAPSDRRDEPVGAQPTPMTGAAPVADHRPPPPRQPSPQQRPQTQQPAGPPATQPPATQPPVRQQPPQQRAQPPHQQPPGPQPPHQQTPARQQPPLQPQSSPRNEIPPPGARPVVTPPPTAPRPAVQHPVPAHPVPAGPASPGPPSKREAKQQEKVVRKDARKRKRRRRRRRISNVFRALIRAVLSAFLTLIIGTIVAVASTGSEVENLSTETTTIVQLAAFIAFFIGMRYFPWPRRLDPNG